VVNALTFVSLVLCVSLCGLWARSYWVSDYLIWQNRPHTFELEAGNGEASVLWGIWAPNRSRPDTGWRPRWYLLDPHHVNLEHENVLGFANFREQKWTPELRADTRAVVVPYWALVVLAAAAPGLVAVRWWRRRRRYATGRCAACGYDLRASPGRCPECGADASVSSPA